MGIRHDGRLAGVGAPGSDRAMAMLASMLAFRRTAVREPTATTMLWGCSGRMEWRRPFVLATSIRPGDAAEGQMRAESGSWREVRAMPAAAEAAPASTCHSALLCLLPAGRVQPAHRQSPLLPCRPGILARIACSSISYLESRPESAMIDMSRA